MLELIKLLPNILAQLMSSLHKPFYSNLIYSFGYLIFIHHNMQIHDVFQFRYFVFMEFLAVGGVIWHVWELRKHKTPSKTKSVYNPPSNGCYSAAGELDLSNIPKGGSGLPARPPKDYGLIDNYSGDD